MQTQEEKVKNYSLKKYPCKRNKGEHEYLEPIIKSEPSVAYIYKTKESFGTVITHSLKPRQELKLFETRVRIEIETICKHCGHKNLTFLSGKL
jgi:uncharacterized membrane protein YkgB